MEWNWFFSSLAQSVAAIVGLFGAFIISSVINNTAAYKRKCSKSRELIAASERLAEQLQCREFDWYNEIRMERALRSLRSFLKSQPNATADEVYDQLNFSRFLPRFEAIAQINEALEIERRENHKDFGYITLDKENLAIESQSLGDESELINGLIVEAKHQTRLVSSHLGEIHGNPERSALVDVAIFFMALLFLVGVIGPLCFLPTPTDFNDFAVPVIPPFKLSVRTFFLLFVNALFFLFLFYLRRENDTLVYPHHEVQKLMSFTKIDNYSDYLRIMEENEMLKLGIRLTRLEENVEAFEKKITDFGKPPKPNTI